MCYSEPCRKSWLQSWSFVDFNHDHDNDQHVYLSLASDDYKHSLIIVTRSHLFVF